MKAKGMLRKKRENERNGRR